MIPIINPVLADISVIDKSAPIETLIITTVISKNQTGGRRGSAGVTPIRGLRSSKGGDACTDLSHSNCRPGHIHSGYGGITAGVGKCNCPTTGG